MPTTPREALYARLPAVTSPRLLYDFDVLLTGDGTFLTVAQAWHGPDGVAQLVCLPGALPLSLLGTAFGTNLPEVLLQPSGPEVLLLGTFSGGRQPRLAADGEAPEEDALRARFPGYGRYALAELVPHEAVRPGDVLVLEDGHAHAVGVDGTLALLEPATGLPAPSRATVRLDAYLARRDLPELPLTRLR